MGIGPNIGPNGHWTKWALDQVGIGPNGYWTKWALDQMGIGPNGFSSDQLGLDVMGFGRNGFRRNGNLPSGSLLSWLFIQHGSSGIFAQTIIFGTKLGKHKSNNIKPPWKTSYKVDTECHQKAGRLSVTHSNHDYLITFIQHVICQSVCHYHDRPTAMSSIMTHNNPEGIVHWPPYIYTVIQWTLPCQVQKLIPTTSCQQWYWIINTELLTWAFCY